MLSRKATIGVFVALTLTVGGAAACSSSKSSSSGGTGGGSGSAGGGGGSAQAAGQHRAVAEAANQHQYHPTADEEAAHRQENLHSRKALSRSRWRPTRASPTRRRQSAGRSALFRRAPARRTQGRRWVNAIDQHPDAIFISGQTLSTMRAQIERAKAEKIPVFQSDSGEPVAQDGSIYVLSLDSFQQTGAWGKMIADYIATQGQQAHPRRRPVRSTRSCTHSPRALSTS